MARALARQSQIVILDEATGKFDFEATSLLLKSLQAHKTIFLLFCISHSLGRLFDRSKNSTHSLDRHGNKDSLDRSS